MTDNEIKKALECCIKSSHCLLDLINRLQGEVKRLENHLVMSKKEIKKCVTRYKMACTERNEFLEQLKTAKAEAYKECIEKVKEIDCSWYVEEYYLNGEMYSRFRTDIFNSKLDNLLKEKVGE